MILDISNAFLDRRSTPFTDPALVQRIFRAYALSKAQTAPDFYAVGNEWLPIYRDHMGPFMSALASSDLDCASRLMANFYRESMSAGLHGFDLAMVQTYMDPAKPPSAQQLTRYRDFILRNLEIFVRTIPDMNWPQMTRPLYGNPYGYELDGTFYSFGAEMHYYFFHRIRQLLGGNPKPVVAELGGGFGGVGYFLSRHLPGLRYYCFDLPENMALQASYLGTCLPDRHIVLVGECDLDRLHDTEGDIFILPNFAIEHLKEDTCDLCFNSYSLAEMEPDAISNYTRILCAASRQYFFHVNHALICKMSADLFPIDFTKFELLQRAPAMWGGNNDKVIDIHEYVYRTRAFGYR